MMPMSRFPRSLRVSQSNIDRVKLAILRKGYSSQKMLAKELELSRSTVSNFFNGRSVLVINFFEICEHLNLSWEEIADLDIS